MKFAEVFFFFSIQSCSHRGLMKLPWNCIRTNNISDWRITSNSINMYFFIYPPARLLMQTSGAVDLLIALKGSFVQQLFRAQSADVTQLTYFAVLQLQLGGLGRTNYTLHTNNPARPMELWDSGLNSAEITGVARAPAFAKDASSRDVVASFVLASP